MPGPKPDVPDQEVLRMIASAPDPVVTSSELAEALDMSQQGAYNRLSSLEENGFVRSRKVGASARVWWITDTGRSELPPLGN
ncbi:helix-turn-helix domain-containing protein [Halobaculum magnesiiphilum]